MGQVTIKYRDSQGEPQEIPWQNGFTLNPASEAGIVSLTDTDNEETVLRSFDTQGEAETFREWLWEGIQEGLGNGTIVIDTDDF